ncbi:DUF2569 family protein [Lentisphaerota bacterium WC36G]|nr:DUF2569 domain-containing protein [Lentisphaerae bacterium WC36]
MNEILEVTEEKKSHPIGGWLILISILLLAGVIVSFCNALLYFIVTLKISSAHFNPKTILFIILMLTSGFLHSVIFIMFKKKSKHIPKIMIFLYLIFTITTVILTLNANNVTQAIYRFIFVLIPITGIIYFWKSKRVKETFIN